MLKGYSEVKEELRFIFGSEVRLKVLLALRNGPMELSEMRTVIRSSSSTILHAIYQLEEKRMVSRTSRRYELSATGRIISLKVQGIIRSLLALGDLSEFLIDHDLSSIPDHLLSSIEALEGATILESKPENLTEPYEVVAKNALNSERVWILSGVYQPFYGDLMRSRVKAEIILSEDLAAPIESDLPQNVRIHTIPEKLNFSLIITEGSMALSLFLSDGLYDTSRVLFSRDDEAIEWAWSLFRHFTDEGVG
ncbi:helix-turn-helix transcriptional regulator [Methanothermobacter sp.]|uniref:helix-turn-helix transcriptional regulator n=1 Tax=Methanothermobacter sp. TaxID=1884223 RepID=UPI003C76503E